MTIRVVMARGDRLGRQGSGATAIILRMKSLALAEGAVARQSAGQDAGGLAAGLPSEAGVKVSGSLDEALRKAPSDVVVDYTKPDAVKANTLLSISNGRHVVISTSRL